MIVCLCRGVTDTTLRALVESGATSVEELTRRCGAGGECGACRPMLAEIVEECTGALLLRA